MRARPLLAAILGTVSVCSLSCNGDDLSGPATGTLAVNTATTGTEPDPDGYTLTVDTGSPKAIGSADRLVIPELASGNHTIRLGGLASNCAVVGENPRTIGISAGSTIEASLSVSCTGTTGSLQITWSTSGLVPDPDGYTLTMDGQDPQALAAAGTALLVGLAPGVYRVELSGVAGNCEVKQSISRTVTISAGQPTPLTFEVTCLEPRPASLWGTIPLPPRVGGSEPLTPTGIWASSPVDIFVTGYYSSGVNAVVLHYDGNSWSQQLSVSGGSGNVWGTAPCNVFAVLNTTEVLHYDCTRWADVGPKDNESFYYTVWGTSQSDLFAGGWYEAEQGYATLRRFGGGSWDGPEGLGLGSHGEVYDISGSSSNDVYALGRWSPYDVEPEEDFSVSSLSRFNGNSWAEIMTSTVYYTAPGESYALKGVWASAPSDVFVVGTRGRILHFNGTAWSPMTSPTSQDLFDIWGTSGSNVYAVGAGGILHYDGAQWSVLNQNPGTRIWGTATDVFVLGEGVILWGPASE